MKNMRILGLLVLALSMPRFAVSANETVVTNLERPEFAPLREAMNNYGEKLRVFKTTVDDKHQTEMIFRTFSRSLPKSEEENKT